MATGKVLAISCTTQTGARQEYNEQFYNIKNLITKTSGFYKCDDFGNHRGVYRIWLRWPVFAHCWDHTCQLLGVERILTPPERFMEGYSQRRHTISRG